MVHNKRTSINLLNALIAVQSHHTIQITNPTRSQSSHTPPPLAHTPSTLTRQKVPTRSATNARFCLSPLALTHKSSNPSKLIRHQTTTHLAEHTNSKHGHATPFRHPNRALNPNPPSISIMRLRYVLLRCVERVGSSLSNRVWRAYEPRAEECERIEAVSDW